MMRLYLAQHGLALSKQDDPARPLSEEGERNVRDMANLLGDGGVEIGRVWHSGKLRAGQTAALLAKRVLPAGKPEPIDGIAPNDSVDEFIVDVDVWQEDTLVVGHLPFMSRLASLLIAGDAERSIVEFKPGSVLCLERIAPHQWLLLWMLRPELQRSETQP